MPFSCGLRVGLGVSAGGTAVVGSGVATTTHTGATNVKGQRNKVSPQSSPQCHGSYFLTNPARKTVTVSQIRDKLGDTSHAMILRLGNLPATIMEEELAEILAPWGPSMGSAALESCPESGAKTFTAQMEYQAALDAIAKLDQSVISGHRVIAVGESLPASEDGDASGDPDVLLE